MVFCLDLTLKLGFGLHCLAVVGDGGGGGSVMGGIFCGEVPVGEGWFLLEAVC